MLLQHQIAANRRNSVFLGSVIILVLVAIGYLAGALLATPLAGVIIAAVVAVVVSLMSYYQGDQVVLSYSHAVPIEKKDNPQLFDVVEELSIGAGIPMPKVYLIEDEAPNAFATGRDPEHASVAITTGLLEKLERSELQGVMAHELSHIRNRDILFMMMMGVLAGSIVLIADYVTRYLFWMGPAQRGRGSKNRSQANQVLMIVGLIFIILAPIIARLIQMAVSRQREYLADASGAELTRYPEGLASALEKLRDDPNELHVANRATAHLFIVNPFSHQKKAELNSFFDTHPPLEERIRRLRAMT